MTSDEMTEARTSAPGEPTQQQLADPKPSPKTVTAEARPIHPDDGEIRTALHATPLCLIRAAASKSL
jgi:hypothetical protein